MTNSTLSQAIIALEAAIHHLDSDAKVEVTSVLVPNEVVQLQVTAALHGYQLNRLVSVAGRLVANNSKLLPEVSSMTVEPERTVNGTSTICLFV